MFKGGKHLHNGRSEKAFLENTEDFQLFYGHRNGKVVGPKAFLHMSSASDANRWHKAPYI